MQVYSSPALLDEVTEVISRPTFTRQLALVGKNAPQVLADYLEIVEPTEVPHIARDPDDDHVLACALAAKADFIVSGDKDLLDLHEYQGIPILAAADALQRLASVQP